MSVYLLDSDTLTLWAAGHERVREQINDHSDAVRIPIIVIDETVSGRQAAIHRAKTLSQQATAWNFYTQSVELISSFPAVTLSLTALQQFQTLLKLKLNVGGNDLRIAAIALELAATVVTRNARDFGRVPGLNHVDWSI